MFFIIALVVLVAGIIWAVRFRTDPAPEYGQPGYGSGQKPATHVDIAFPKLGLAILAFFVIAFVVPSFFGIVPAGHRGVVLRFGGVTGTVLGGGLYVVTPFIESVVVMTVQTVTTPVKAVEAASADLQTVTTDVTVNWSLEPERVVSIYENLGYGDISNRIVIPAVQEHVKAATAQFQAEDLIRRRAVVKDRIETDLRTKLATYGMRLDAVNITNFDFSEEYNKSIEAKVIEEQRALGSRNITARVEEEAKQRITQAQGEAEAIRAQSEALRNSPELVQLEWVRRWDGKLPQTMLGEGAVPLVNVGGGR